MSYVQVYSCDVNVDSTKMYFLKRRSDLITKLEYIRCKIAMSY